jgi:hypothetical protein
MSRHGRYRPNHQILYVLTVRFPKYLPCLTFSARYPWEYTSPEDNDTRVLVPFSTRTMPDDLRAMDHTRPVLEYCATRLLPPMDLPIYRSLCTGRLGVLDDSDVPI